VGKGSCVADIFPADFVSFHRFRKFHSIRLDQRHFIFSVHPFPAEIHQPADFDGHWFCHCIGTYFVVWQGLLFFSLSAGNFTGCYSFFNEEV
jgi:hypothetical protein